MKCRYCGAVYAIGSTDASARKTFCSQAHEDAYCASQVEALTKDSDRLYEVLYRILQGRSTEQDA